MYPQWGSQCTHMMGGMGEGGNWSAWLQTGQDAGSTVSAEVPAVVEMVSWGEALLGF